MTVLVDLISQVQKVLPQRFGGTGNTSGWGNDAVISAYPNLTGSTLARGTLVKLNRTLQMGGGIALDARITPTTTENEQTVLGVVVGRYSMAVPVGAFDDADVEDGDMAAVCTYGRCVVLIEGIANVGQYAYAAATDGRAHADDTIKNGAAGTFESGGEGTAVVRLWGAGGSAAGAFASIQGRIGDGETAITGGMLDDIPDIPFNCTITHVTMLAKSSGDITIDILRSSYAGFSGSLTSICNTAGGGILPNITSGIKYFTAAPALMYKDIDEGDVIRFIVTAAAGVSQLSVALRVRRR